MHAISKILFLRKNRGFRIQMFDYVIHLAQWRRAIMVEEIAVRCVKRKQQFSMEEAELTARSCFCLRRMKRWIELNDERLHL